MNNLMGSWRNGRRCGLKRNLSAPVEMRDVELLKVGEACKMVIPSQAIRKRWEGVETRRAASKAKRLWWRDSPDHKSSVYEGAAKAVDGKKIRWP